MAADARGALASQVSEANHVACATARGLSRARAHAPQVLDQLDPPRGRALVGGSLCGVAERHTQGPNSTDADARSVQSTHAGRRVVCVRAMQVGGALHHPEVDGIYTDCACGKPPIADRAAAEALQEAALRSVERVLHTAASRGKWVDAHPCMCISTMHVRIHHASPRAHPSCVDSCAYMGMCMGVRGCMQVGVVVDGARGRAPWRGVLREHDGFAPPSESRRGRPDRACRYPRASRHHAPVACERAVLDAWLDEDDRADPHCPPCSGLRACAYMCRARSDRSLARSWSPPACLPVCACCAHADTDRV